MTDERNRLFALEALGRPVRAKLANFAPGKQWAVVGAGQSNALSPWAYPTLSNIAYDGNLVFGGSLPPGNADETYQAYDPLAPLRAKFSSYLPPEQQVPPTYVIGSYASRSEEPVIATCNYFKALSNERRGLESDPSRTLVAANIAKAGAPLGYLLKNHPSGSYEYYGRYLDLVSRFSGDILAIAMMQGEADYYGTTLHKTRALYKTGLAQYRTDLVADAAGAEPLFLMSIPGGVETKDVDGLGAPDLHVSMAIQELGRETSAVCVGPYYAMPKLIGGTYPDPIHLVARGSRDWGLKTAQAAARVLLDGLSWEPCAPLQVTQTGPRKILVDLLVPSPPIQFAPAQGVTLASKGFYVVDAVGAVSITVAIVGATQIEITTSRDLSGAVILYYAGKSGYGANGDGLGNVCDSDPTCPDLSLWGTDLTPADMRNWLVPFCVSLPWARPGL